MSELPLDALPAAADDVTHQAARGHVVYITEGGNRLAAIPAEFAAALENLDEDQARELLEDLADAADVLMARAAREAGEPVVPREQVKAEMGL